MAITFIPAAATADPDAANDQDTLRAELSEALADAARWRRKYEMLVQSVVEVGEGLMDIRMAIGDGSLPN
ncbi:hypothetical protein [Acidisphaera sp. L21]|uniref:hypothetical protein n=1 Tax=Acidisphaera sp. L21 TaxID=1641851 RepID=UPI00131CA14E|nr:hypothetical protein [Acidisphaera sp. L21]